MRVQKGTVVHTEPVDETESEKQQEPFSSTENEDWFKGPRFSPPVYRRRYAAVCELAEEHQAKKVLDFGCAEAKLVKALISKETLIHLEEVVGIDINRDLLEENTFRIKPLLGDYLRPRTHPFKVSLYQGSIGEADERFVDFDLIACVELIEHLELDILNLMPEVVFGRLSPKVVIVTTPNVEFNVLFPGLKGFRHYDHKFEWTRAEFEEWCSFQASKYNYSVSFDGIAPGPQDTQHLGCCTQVAVFKRISPSCSPTNISGKCQPYNLVAEVEYPFRRDTRTEEEKILHEVEYVLWVLSSKEEEEEEKEGDDDWESAGDELWTPKGDSEIELPDLHDGDDTEPRPSSDGGNDKATPIDNANNELKPRNEGDDEPTPTENDDNELTPCSYIDNEPRPINGDDHEWTPSNGNDHDHEWTPSNGKDETTPSDPNDNSLTSSSFLNKEETVKDVHNDGMAVNLDEKRSGPAERFNDRSNRADGGEERIYSLERLLNFPSLHKLCGDIQKLKKVLEDSPVFQITEDGCGVLWNKPSQHWSSEESDIDWDACVDEQKLDESDKYCNLARDEPENWENDDGDEVNLTSGGHILNPSLQSEVCWELPNDCSYKFWNGKDWSEVEEVEECDTLLHHWDNVLIVQESDESLSNNSDETDLDGLVWMTEKSSVVE